jgi:hypothetical protein
VQWRGRAPGLPNEREILLTSLLTIIAAPTVAQLNLWATDVDLEHSRYLEEKEQWEMPVAWRPPSKGKPSAIYEPIIDAFEACPPTETLEQIGKAMRSWRSAGHMAELTPQRIRDYFSEKLLGPAPDPSKPKRAPPRWRTPESLFGVAKLVKNRGIALRKLLKLEEERSDLPTMEESFDMAMELVEDTMEENETLREEKSRIEDAHRKLLERSVDKRAAVSAAKSELRASMEEDAKSKIAALKEGHKEALSTKEMEVEVLAEALAAKDVEKHRKAVCVAQARAREAENGERREQRKKRKVEIELEQLRAAPDDGDAEEDEEEGESEEEASDESDGEQQQQERPATPDFAAFSQRARKDARGRWQAEADEIRALRLAQLARGCAPDIASQNLNDIFALLPGGGSLPATSRAHSHALRTEVTISGEAMAAWKFAKSKRVLFFGWDETTKFGNALFGCNAHVEYADGSREDICLRGLSILPSRSLRASCRLTLP